MMKKLHFSLLGALSLAAAVTFALWPTEAAAYLPPPKDPPPTLFLCYDAHLSVCTDPGGCGGGYNLGWNVGAGPTWSGCQAVLSQMINYASNHPSWSSYGNPHCYSYTSPRECPLGIVPG